MFDISATELQSLCQYICNFPPPFYSIVSDFVNDLYATGCRPTELIQTNRWVQSLIDINYWTMQPQKGNNTREILKSSVSNNLNQAIINQVKPYQQLTVRQLEYSMKQIIPVGHIYKETKEMVSYIFRYNRVKILLGTGATNGQIQTFFGWLNPPMPWNYGSAQISVQLNLLPPETYYLNSNSNDRLIDFDGSVIISQF
jgi:hypothetical protein